MWFCSQVFRIQIWKLWARSRVTSASIELRGSWQARGLFCSFLLVCMQRRKEKGLDKLGKESGEEHDKDDLGEIHQLS